MRRRSPVEPRRVVFVGVEGKSERAFAQFLQRCCEEQGLHLHLNIKLTHAGDSASVAEGAGRYLRKLAGWRDIRTRLVLLDRDRVEADVRAGRDAQKPPTANESSQRFTLADLRRAAQHDEELQRFLSVLGL